jgi:hypothetical protein
VRCPCGGLPYHVGAVHYDVLSLEDRGLASRRELREALRLILST